MAMVRLKDRYLVSLSKQDVEKVNEIFEKLEIDLVHQQCTDGLSREGYDALRKEYDDLMDLARKFSTNWTYVMED